MLRTAQTQPAPGYIRTSDDVDLFYRDWGSGRPIVFMAGWMLSSEAWAYQMTPLSRQGFRCVAYDRRAHGRSTDPGGGFDYDTLADDLNTVLQALDLEDVTLVAHSFASAEALRYLTRCARGRYGARRVSGLLLLAPAAIPYLRRTDDNPLGIDEALADQVRAAFGRDFPGWCEAGAEAYFTPGTSQQVINWTIRDMTQGSLLAAVTLNQLMMNTDFRPELAQIDIPTLIVHGDCDASAPLEITGRPAAALIPNARLEIYEGAPHGLYFTHQERLNADIAQFAATAEADIREVA